MSAARRAYGPWGIEHVVLKGNNKKPIFSDAEDCKYFLNLLRKKQESSTSLISYVLMKNHVHLILKDETPEKISNLIMVVTGTYATWYNEKHGRENSLFRKRFYNEPIKEERHLLNAIRYVHNNPVKANIVKHPQNYAWSSYNEYAGKAKYITKCVFEKYFHKEEYLFSPEQIRYNGPNEESYYKSQEYTFDVIKEELAKRGLKNVSNLSIVDRNEIIATLCDNEDTSYENIARELHLSANYIGIVARKIHKKRSDGTAGAEKSSLL